MYLFFFFNDTPTTQIYTLSLHDALPISPFVSQGFKFSNFLCVHIGGVLALSGHSLLLCCGIQVCGAGNHKYHDEDRKSTRLNSSHVRISYAVFCLKKKKKKIYNTVMSTI